MKPSEERFSDAVHLVAHCPLCQQGHRRKKKTVDKTNQRLAVLYLISHYLASITFLETSQIACFKEHEAITRKSFRILALPSISDRFSDRPIHIFRASRSGDRRILCIVQEHRATDFEAPNL